MPILCKTKAARAGSTPKSCSPGGWPTCLHNRSTTLQRLQCTHVDTGHFHASCVHTACAVRPLVVKCAGNTRLGIVNSLSLFSHQGRMLWRSLFPATLHGIALLGGMPEEKRLKALIHAASRSVRALCRTQAAWSDILRCITPHEPRQSIDSPNQAVACCVACSRMCLSPCKFPCSSQPAGRYGVKRWGWCLLVVTHGRVVIVQGGSVAQLIVHQGLSTA